MKTITRGLMVPLHFLMFGESPFAAPGTRVWLPAASGTLPGMMVVGTDYASNSLAGTLVYPNTTDWNTDNHTQVDESRFTVDGIVKSPLVS